MPIIRWDPLREFDRFFHEDWGLVPMLKKSVPFDLPSMDVYQTDDAVVAELQVPAGIKPERVEVVVEDNMLTIRGESEEEKEEKKKDYVRREIRRGSFERSVMLPARVKEDAAQANYENGVLKVTLPKTEEPKGKKVQVNVKK